MAATTKSAYDGFRAAFKRLAEVVGPAYAIDFALFTGAIELRGGHFDNEEAKRKIEKALGGIREQVHQLPLLEK